MNRKQTTCRICGDARDMTIDRALCAECFMQDQRERYRRLHPAATTASTPGDSARRRARLAKVLQGVRRMT